MIFKTVSDCPDYEVSYCSVIRHKETKQIVKPFLSTNKSNTRYMVKLKVNKKSKLKSVHRVVGEQWLKNPNNLPELNHEDGNRFNNHVRNLRWTTEEENRQHGIDMGIIHASKPIKQLDILDNVVAIYESINNATKYGFRRSSIQFCLNGRQKTYKGYKFQLCE